MNEAGYASGSTHATTGRSWPLEGTGLCNPKLFQEVPFPHASRSLAFLVHSKLEFSCFIKIFCMSVMYSHVYRWVYVRLCVCSPEVNIVPQELSISFLETDFLTDLEFADSFSLASRQVLGIHLSPLLSNKNTINRVFNVDSEVELGSLCLFDRCFANRTTCPAPKEKPIDKLNLIVLLLRGIFCKFSPQNQHRLSSLQQFLQEAFMNRNLPKWRRLICQNMPL